MDLTHTLDGNFPYIPVPGITYPFKLTPIATLEKNGVAANEWHIHEHLGTQIDAPSHFAAGGVAVEALSARELIVPVVVIDYRPEAAADQDAVLTIDRIQIWEKEHGRIPGGSVVVLYTGWDRRIADPSYIGLDTAGVKHFPGLGPEAVRFLAQERDVWGVGVDTVSFDPGADHTYEAHRVLLGAGKWALEALANVDRLPPTGATLFIGAPKVRGATGGIARVIALVPAVSWQAGSLDGRWRSPGVESIRAASGRTTWLTRDFSFSGEQWSVTFTVFADAEGRTPILRGHNEGTFEVGPRMPLAEAFEATFSFTTRSLTPLAEATATALTNAGCGTGSWQVDAAQDVTEAGCAAFRVPSARDCPKEYDVARLSQHGLFLASRPAEGDLCRPGSRPPVAGSARLVRPGG